MAELEHAAALTQKEVELEEMHEKILASRGELRRKVEECEALQSQLRDIRSVMDTAEIEIESLTSSRDELRAANERLQQEKSDLLDRQHDREAELQSIKQDADAAREAHELEIVNLRQGAKVERAALASENEKQLAVIKDQHDNVTADLRQQLDDLQQEHQQTTESNAAQTKQLQKDVFDRQKKIDKLKTKCEYKDEQIAEANAMRANLMAAMGISGSGTSKQTKLAHRFSVRFASETQSQDIDTQADPSPPTPRSGDDDESQQRGAEMSFASSTDSRSGPTPKRPRPRRTVKVASPVKARLSSAAATRSMRRSAGTRTGIGAGVKRQPLLAVSANQVQGRNVGPKTPSKGAGLAPADGMDESTFDGSELFTGTQGRQVLDLDENAWAR
jgi:myosin heavy subunit